MDAPTVELPKTNIDLLKLILVVNPLALELVTAASIGNREEALQAVKQVLLTRLQAELNTLKNGKTEVA